MKKLIISTATLILLLHFVSCKKNETEIKPVANDTIQKPIEDTTVIEPKSESDKLLLDLNNNEVEFREMIKNKKPEDVNNLFDSFREKHESILAKLNVLEEKLLDDYNGFYDEKANEYVIPENLKSKFKGFGNAHLKVEGIGEGYNEIQLDPNYYSQITQNSVTSDYATFLKLEAKDNKVLYQADAGLGITFEEVSNRVLYWENFLTKYPKSKLFNNARELFGTYLMDYLFGMDNTPTIDTEKKELYPENIKEFNRYITKNPTLISAKIVKLMLDNFDKYDDSAKLRDFIDAEQKKYFIPKNN
jgi:hypothetical protein